MFELFSSKHLRPFLGNREEGFVSRHVPIYFNFFVLNYNWHVIRSGFCPGIWIWTSRRRQRTCSPCTCSTKFDFFPPIAPFSSAPPILGEKVWLSHLTFHQAQAKRGEFSICDAIAPPKTVFGQHSFFVLGTTLFPWLTALIKKVKFKRNKKGIKNQNKK